MLPEDIEKEVQARVDFKMQELTTVVQNRIKSHHQRAFSTCFAGDHAASNNHMTAKTVFEEVMDVINKERYMPLPVDEMVMHKKRQAKDKAVDIIMEMMKKYSFGGGNRFYPEVAVKKVVNAIEMAQIY